MNFPHRAHALHDSGQRISDILKLDVEDFYQYLRIADSETTEKTGYKGEYCAIPTIAKKTQSESIVHFGYQAVHAIKRYLEDRRIGPLFIATQRYEYAKGKRMIQQGFTSAVGRHVKKLGKPKLSAHSFRNTFISAYKKQQVDDTYVKVMTGKTIPRDMDTYLQYETTTCYLRFYDAALGLDVKQKIRRDLQAQDQIIRMQEQALNDAQVIIKWYGAIVANPPDPNAPMPEIPPHLTPVLLKDGSVNANVRRAIADKRPDLE